MLQPPQMRPDELPPPSMPLGMADCPFFFSAPHGPFIARSSSSSSAAVAPHQQLLHITGDVSCYREGSLHRLIAARNIQGVRQWLSNPFCRDAINDFNHAGETPLHVAFHVCEPRILSLLLNPPSLQMPPQCVVTCGGSTTDQCTVALAAGQAVPCEWTTDAACAAATAATATVVDFSLPLDDLPALHILVGRSSFPQVRADAAECLRRLLHHVGLLYAATGESRVCHRCSLTSSRSSRREPQGIECGRQELDLDATDGSGKTALHVAAAAGGAAAVELLLHAGADPLVADKRGLLPLHVAVDSRSVECLLLLLAHSLPSDCFLWDEGRDVDPLKQQPQRLVIGSATEAAIAAGGTQGDATGVRASKRVVLQRAERRPLVQCATSSCLIYRTARRCVRRSSFRCLAALLSYPMVPASAASTTATSSPAAAAAAVESCMALQLLDAQQLRELISLARRSGCRRMFLTTLSELVDSELALCSVAKRVIEEIGGEGLGTAPLVEPVYVQQRCSRSGRSYRVPEEAGTLLATHETCMHHLPLPEPSDFPVKRFKLMQRFPENPSRLEVLVHPSSGVLKAAEFRHLEWIDSAAPASLADVLRVHDVSYIFKLKQKIRSTFGTRTVKSPSNSSSSNAYGGSTGVDQFAYSFADGDTPVTALSWEAATCAAGTVIAAVDAVCTGAKVNAFCAVRPPGHHLGSWGAAQTAPYALTDEDIAAGSQGFCVLNNVAIGAAYARYNYASKGIRRIAIVDFDAHHGNGTEQIIRNVGLKFRKLQGLSALLSDSSVPSSGQRLPRESQWGGPSDSWESEGPRGATDESGGLQDVPVQLPVWLGWRDESDSAELFFASIHAFDGNFYPGTGADCEDFSGPTVLNVTMPVHDACYTPVDGTEGEGCCRCDRCCHRSCSKRPVRAAGVYRCHYCRRPGLSPRSIRSRLLFKRRVLSRLDAFAPDLIFLSAGFDGHIKDPIGGEVVGWTEDDFYWLTMQVQRVAHRHCNGRCVSVLEGGYNVRGGAISPLALCVREHVRALVKAAHMHLEPPPHSEVVAESPSGALVEGGEDAGMLLSGSTSSATSGGATASGYSVPPAGAEAHWEDDELSDDGSESGFSSSDDDADAFLGDFQEYGPAAPPPFFVDTTSGHVVSPAMPSITPLPTFRPGPAGSSVCGQPPMPSGPCSKEPLSGHAAAPAEGEEWAGNEEPRMFQAIQEGARSPSAISSLSEDGATASSTTESAATAQGSMVTRGPPAGHQPRLTVVATSTSASDAETSPRLGMCEPSTPDDPEHYSKALRLHHLCGFST